MSQLHAVSGTLIYLSTQYQKLKEMNQVTKCLRQRLTWCNRTGQSYDPNKEQYSLYQTKMGVLIRGLRQVEKQNWEKIQHWSLCSSIRGNAIQQVLLLPYFQAQVKELHLLFDTPSQQIFNPKSFEKQRRDQDVDGTNTNHQHNIIYTFNKNTQQLANLHQLSPVQAVNNTSNCTLLFTVGKVQTYFGPNTHCWWGFSADHAPYCIIEVMVLYLHQTATTKQIQKRLICEFGGTQLKLQIGVLSGY